MANNKLKDSVFYRLGKQFFYTYKAATMPKKDPVISLDTHEDHFSIDLSNRSSIEPEFLSLAAKYDCTLSGSTISDYYFSEPLNEKAIVMVGLGKNVRGNLQYILNELNYSDRFEGYHIYVRTSAETDSIVKEYIRKNKWTRTTTEPGHKPYCRLLESCKYLITEVYMPESWVKKPGQVFISIWHGTPLKRLGLAKYATNSHRNGTTQKNFIDADYLMYPNPYTRKNLLESYQVSQLMQGQALMLGYPRTGGMLAAADADQSDLRKQLAPNGERIYAYMPTFRDYLSDEQSILETKELLDYLDAGLRSDQILYVNLHHRLDVSIDYSGYTHIRQFPPTVDSYKLLAETDALISDYSSVFFDYLALRKQIILFISDYQDYCSKRGTYMDLLSMPFDMVLTKEDVLAALNRGKTYDDEAAWNEFCPYDTTENAKKLCQLLYKDFEGLSIGPIPNDHRKRLLIFSNAFEPGCETELLHSFTRQYDREIYDVYLSCETDPVDTNKESAYPMLHENCVIGAEHTYHLTNLGKMAKELYLSGKISFEKAMRCLKYDYALVPNRMYGQAATAFETVVIYDIDDPERILSLTEMSMPKILCLPQSVLQKIADGDRFLKDAVRYAAKYSCKVCVFSDSNVSAAEELLGSFWNGKIQTIHTADDLERIIIN